MTYAEVRKAAEGNYLNELEKETDIQVRNYIDKAVIPTFIKGANWRVNASWHEAWYLLHPALANSVHNSLSGCYHFQK